jgi:multidrug efflux pump subunit AcrA (membrane-fusion protein)
MIPPPAAEAGGIHDPALWKRLAAVPDDGEFAASWLALQAGFIAGTRRALVLLPASVGTPAPVAWPDGAAIADLVPVAAQAIAAAKGVAQPDPDAKLCRLAFPVPTRSGAAGAVALECAARDEQAIRRAMRDLQWGTGWLRARFGGVEESGRLGAIVDLMTAAAEAESHRAACLAVATEAAQIHGCDRVSIGFVRGNRSRIAAISHSALFGQQMNLVRMLEAAMDEAIDQQAILVHPAPPDESNVTHAHAEFAARQGSAIVLTCPLVLHDRFTGAITLERPADRPFDSATIAAIDALAGALAPILEDKRRGDRWAITVAGAALARGARALLGPGHAAAKLALLAAAGLAALFAFWTAPYRVTAEAVIEGSVQHAVVASFNGFIREAPVRPGDVVAAGQLVAALDDRELALERLRWVTERQRRVIEYDRALSDRNRAETRALASMIEQAEAQIRLVDEQLGRTRLTAPFAGLVVSGDLTQSIGAAVQRGQTLLEIAPVDDYRVVLQVEESQIGDIRAGGAGTLVATSLPHQAYPVSIARITPVSTAREGRNTFRVEARLERPVPELRPGMRGVAKIEIDTRRVIWTWTRAAQNWARLALWRWFG